MSLTELLLSIANFCNYVIPKKKNQIFFYSSPDYSDNARAIYEKLLSVDCADSYSTVWAVRDVEKYKEVLKESVVVRHRSLQSLWHFCRSKYIVRTHSLWGNNYVKGRQVMCIAWHGMPLKRMSSEDTVRKRTECNFVTSTSGVFDEELTKSMGLALRACMHTGLPRNDELFVGGNDLVKMYPGFSKRIIWMPTFRRTEGYVDGVDSELGIPCVKSGDLVALNEALTDLNCLLILKLHPWSVTKIGKLNYSNIKLLEDSNIANGVSLYRLLGQTDALITDYSSVYIDYLLIDKPICFAYDDLEEYRSSRGFVFEPVETYMPGQKARSAEDLIRWIEECCNGIDEYARERMELRKLFHDHIDDRSSERVIREIGLFS